MEHFEPEARSSKKGVVIGTTTVVGLIIAGVAGYYFIPSSFLSSAPKEQRAETATTAEPVTPKIFSGKWSSVGFPASALAYTFAETTKEGVTFYGVEQGQLSSIRVGTRDVSGKTKLAYPVSGQFSLLSSADGKIEHVASLKDGVIVFAAPGENGAISSESKPLPGETRVRWVALKRDPNGMPVAFAGVDQSSILATAWKDGKWGDWMNMGGALKSPASIVVTEKGIELFAIGMDENVWTTSYLGPETPPSWSQIGARGKDTPAAAYDAASKTVVVANVSDRGVVVVRRRAVTGTRWEASETVELGVKDPVRIVSSMPDEMVALMTDAQNQLKAVAFSPSTGAISPPKSLEAGEVTAAAAMPGNEGMAMVAKAPSKALFVYRVGAPPETSAEAEPDRSDRQPAASKRAKKK